MRGLAWLAVPLAGLGLLLLFAAMSQGSVEQSVVYALTGLLVVGASIATILRRRPDGWRAWLLLAAGQAAFVLGDVLWTVNLALGVDPFPSIADVAYVAGYPLLAIGLGLAIRRRVGGGDRAGLLDAAILATGVSLIWWTGVLEPVASTADPEPLVFWISTAYPLGDLLLIGMALALLTTPGARTSSFRFLFFSLATMLVADLAYNLQSLAGTYVDGGAPDVLWLVAYTAFSSAALHPTMAGLLDPRPVPIALLGPARLALLGCAMLIGPALLTVERSGAGSVILVVAVAMTLLSMLVLVRLAGLVGHLTSDIERRISLEAQLSFQAMHDPLTGLGNRRRFFAAVSEARAPGAGSAVLFVDLDDFKDVNDQFGHDAGDAYLRVVGGRLLAGLRPGDLACRIGGDEFAVLLSGDLAPSEAERVGNRLLESLGVPIVVDGRRVAVSASIGLALMPEAERLEADELLRRADVAMYHAKARGKHRLMVYRAELEPDVLPEPSTASPQPAPATVRRNPAPAAP
jgi:diguanylate cyclase (GGDEF)-like protein